ncbi:UNVERIFIED_ORG: hypothetical protein FHR35_000538 [Microbispora rosea subsp. rosea]
MLHDYIGCWHEVSGQSGGTASDCAWAIGSIVVPPAIKTGYAYAVACVRPFATARA